MSIDRTAFNALVDEPDGGDNTTGSRWGKAAIADVLLDPIDAALAAGGVPTAALANHGVILGSGAGNPIRAITPASTGLVLTSQGASADPIWSSVSGGEPKVVAWTATGAQNDAGLQSIQIGNVFAEFTGSADVTYSGFREFMAAPTTTGRVLTFRNTTSTKIAWFLHNSGLSAAANRLINLATSAPTPVAPGGWISYMYDGSVWQLVGHNQGAWIASTYSAANFTGSGAMTWTVDSADVVFLRWFLAGKSLTVSFALTNTSVGGTPNLELRIGNGAWGGFSASGAQFLTSNMLNDNAGPIAAGFMQLGTIISATAISNYRPALANWSASSHQTNLYGTITFEVG